jgi:hypothetical protein
MPTNTYVALDKVTVGTATGTVTFTSINQGYTDLVLVANVLPAGSARVKLRVDGDSGSNYSYTVLTGDGSTATSGRYSANEIDLYWANLPSGWSNYICNFQNYSNTATFKTILSRGNSTAVESLANVGLWRSTSAIDSITIFASVGTFEPGSTFSLYGIAATSVGAKATGGDIYTDSQYYYHVFDSTGTFTPLQSLSADILCVAGGGGGGFSRGAGGGAGGVIAHTSQSLTTTGYTVTVGAGGSAGTSAQGGDGVNSSFTGLTAAVGGGGGGGAPSINGRNGGSGGGSAPVGTVGTATSGQGNNGGVGASDGSTYYNAGGGGGAGAAGSAGNSSTGGNGGNGSTTYSSWGSATGIGQNVSGTYYLAGGGGGGRQGAGTAAIGGLGGGGGAGVGTDAAGIAGTVNTGGGGGGGRNDTVGVNGGAGGSGVVIVRYAK